MNKHPIKMFFNGIWLLIKSLHYHFLWACPLNRRSIAPTVLKSIPSKSVAGRWRRTRRGPPNTDKEDPKWDLKSSESLTNPPV